MVISKENLERFVGDCPDRPDLDGMLLSNGYAYSTNGKILVMTKLPDPQERYFCKEYEDFSAEHADIWIRSWQVRELLFFLKSQKLASCAVAKHHFPAGSDSPWIPSVATIGAFYHYEGTLVQAVDPEDCLACDQCPFRSCVSADCAEVNDSGKVLYFRKA